MLKIPAVFLGLALLVLPFSAGAQNGKSIIAAGAKPEKLAEGFIFTEGPIADKKGNVYFTDQPNDKIMVWTVDGELETFLDKTGRANGMFFDRGGRRLITASDGENEIWSIDVKTKEHEVLVDNFEGKRFNGPNDLWVHPDGGVYFTDPLYARDYWTTRTPERQLPGEYVYYLSPDRRTVTIADGEVVKPNGIIGTPDGKILYVADIQARRTYAYDIEHDGTLTGKRLAAPMGSDGMTIDSEGNIYLTGRGVTVFNPQGDRIEYIPIDGSGTSNVCFGGKDGKTLFITATKSLYGIRMNVKGVKTR